jgi:hypothetical protein
VVTAKEALKPDAVRGREQGKRGKRAKRQRRKTDVFIRQGEWFFIPAPDVQVNEKLILTNKHAVKGEHLTRAILRDLDCDLATREQIARLVRFHGRPAFLLERSEPVHEVVRLSWLVSNRLLYLFALADTRGRDTDSMTRPEENLHYWKLLAEENGCYDEPYPFANDHARFLFFRQREPNLHYIPHEAFTCRVTVLSGLPGSGKDTWLARNRPDTPVVSLDDIRGELRRDPARHCPYDLPGAARWRVQVESDRRLHRLDDHPGHRLGVCPLDQCDADRGTAGGRRAVAGTDAGLRDPVWPSGYTMCNLNGQMLRLVNQADVTKQLNTLGPDAMTQPYPIDEIRAALAATELPISEGLLDQSVLAGVGNIAKSEILFQTGLDPRIPANKVPGPAM